MKKLKVKHPAWLVFALCNLAAKEKWTPEHGRLADRVIEGLERHLQAHDLQNDTITKPNLHDNHTGYMQHTT